MSFIYAYLSFYRRSPVVSVKTKIKWIKNRRGKIIDQVVKIYFKTNSGEKGIMDYGKFLRGGFVKKKVMTEKINNKTYRYKNWIIPANMLNLW